MSVKQITRVFADTSITSNQKLIMLALADCANHEGTCYPSLKTLETKCSLSRRTLIDNINKLVEAGLLLKRIRSKKCGGRTSTKYLLYPYENISNLDDIGRDEFSIDISQSAATALPPKVQPPHPPSAATAPPYEPSLEPSLKEKNKTKKESAKNAKRNTSINTYLAGSEVCPDDFYNFASTDRGWSDERIRATFEQFVDYWRSEGKTKADWLATWRNWCRRQKPSNAGAGRTANNAGTGGSNRGGVLDAISEVVVNRYGKCDGDGF